MIHISSALKVQCGISNIVSLLLFSFFIEQKIAKLQHRNKGASLWCMAEIIQKINSPPRAYRSSVFWMESHNFAWQSKALEHQEFWEGKRIRAWFSDADPRKQQKSWTSPWKTRHGRQDCMRMNAFDSIFDKRRKKFAGGHLCSYRVEQHLKKIYSFTGKRGKNIQELIFSVQRNSWTG